MNKQPFYGSILVLFLQLFLSNLLFSSSLQEVSKPHVDSKSVNKLPKTEADNSPSPASRITRGPYLQMATSSAMTIRWRTDVKTNSQVRFGTNLSQLGEVTNSSELTTEHEVRLTGLKPNTKYYYSVGSSSQTFVRGSTYQFETSPVKGNREPTRIWVIGDSGTNGRHSKSEARNVYNAYQTNTGSAYTDLWLMLGDNAYNNGTDREYQTAVFDLYSELLRQTPLWSTMGNHDGYSADSTSESGPYYDIFTFPRQAEAGGVASGTEAYYSFDHGNIHFIVLDSYGTNRSKDGAMMRWLEADLQNTDSDWTIAYWHHPPYSKGSHDSDKDRIMTEMRSIALPVLENYGVDLVLSGHSHSYERSKFIEGHYQVSSTFNKHHVKQLGSGRADDTGVYHKQTVGESHAGAIYAVAGSSGKIEAKGNLDHPAMHLSLLKEGSMILNINGLTLNAQFIDGTGVRRDYFTITKGIANLVATPIKGKATLKVNFDGTGSKNNANITQYDWSFGDGNRALDTDAIVSHIYTTPGVYNATLTVTDDTGKTAEASQLITVIDPNAPTVLDIQVNKSSDDAEEFANGKMYLDSSDLELIQESSKQTVGIRFKNIAIPKGAVIGNAYIQFQADEVSSRDTKITVHGEASTNPKAFTKNNHDISSRTLTNAKVPWTPVAWSIIGAKDKDQRSSDISTIIQELVDQSDWKSGQPMVFVLTGKGKRVADSFDGSHTSAPILHIEYKTLH